jgi:hypothetical protein
MQDHNSILPPPKRTPWNKGKLIGAKPPLLARHVSALSAAIRPTILDRDSAAFDPTHLAQALDKSRGPGSRGRRRTRTQPDGRRLRRLRMRRERPRGRRAAEQRDELAAFQPIELHADPASLGRIAGYRFRGGQSAGTPAILQLDSRLHCTSQVCNGSLPEPLVSARTSGSTGCRHWSGDQSVWSGSHMLLRSSCCQTSVFPDSRKRAGSISGRGGVW